jgi:hypothetical protein
MKTGINNAGKIGKDSANEEKTRENGDMDKIKKIIDVSKEKKIKIYSAIKTKNMYNEINNDIEYIFECAFAKRKSIWENCIDNIYELAAVSNEIREKIINIMENGNVHEKFIITCTLDIGFYKYNLDISFIKKILNYSISDKNKRIKIFGVQRADDMNFYDFAEIIKNEIDKTNDSEIKNRLTTNYIYLTKGYIIKEIGKRKYAYITYHFAEKLPLDIIQEDKIHLFIIEKCKDRNRIKDLYYKK